MKTGLKLLWVDDDADGLLRPLGRFLVRGGFAVQKVADVSSAEQRLTNDTFDAVLLDLILPISPKQRAVSPYPGLYIAKGIRDGKYWDEALKRGTRPKTTIVLLSYLGSDPVIVTEVQELLITSFDKACLLEPRKIDELVCILGYRESSA